MANAKVAISIVTYNSKHIFKVLENLKQEFGHDPQFRFVIFDNNSTDDYQNRLKEYQDIADITFYHENNGFGFGHNYNLLHASEKYFLVFNPDIILVRDDLLKMIEILDRDETISLLVPKVLNADGTTQHLIRDRVSVFDYFLRFVPFQIVKKMFAGRLASYECRDLPDDRNVEIRIGSGCFMLLRGKDFKDVGGFDDRYFMYFEDYDLCIELKKRNKRIVYTPFSNVTHYYERGAHKNSNLFKIFMKSMYKYFNKWGWKWF
ncbi:glycosyltransferase family 2 protein [Neobacillus ginsengisoli]|uniref:GT2 family glycosyltransferase n=1 Tax=Neobacillus ginsengisoli TaxID=904295 RepID=A0ABT9XU41_9BACI|nr:glycosyltransferase family 2 protein [Neobacillus ginsengisoli]MDQ0199073.1 GT2 family glycosyltransferase [Neobacillus ginsengisoli]